MAIIPLIKKNLFQIKRNPIKTFFELFYPCIIISIMIAITSIGGRAPPDIPEQNYSKYYTNFTLSDKNYSFLSKWFYYHGLLGILSNNNEITKSFLYFFHNVSNLKVNTKTFESIDEIKLYKNSSLDKNLTLTLVIQLETNADKLDFSIFKTQSILNDQNSQWDDINPFNLAPRLLGDNILFDCQKLLSEFLIYRRNITQPPNPNVILNLLPQKTPKMISSSNSENALYSILLPIFFTFSYISILFKFVLWLVTEKEKKLNDLLYRQGITNFQYLFSWFLTFLILTVVPLIICGILLKIYFITKTNIIIILLNLFFYNINIISMAFLVQHFCEDQRSGQTILKIFYIGVSFLSIPLSDQSVPIIIRYLACIFPQVVLKYTFEILINADKLLNGLSISLMTINYKDFSLLSIWIIFIFDFILYLGLYFMLINWHSITIYFKNLSKSKKIEDNLSMISDKLIIESKDNIQTLNEEILNPEHIDQEKNNECLKISNLKKNFDQLKVVDDVTLKLYKNQIFVLLGHNGAGKTTMINIISGMLSSDSGDVMLDSHNLLEERDYLFKNIGLCSQDDIYFDDLTVIEHLEIMSEIKGKKVNSEEINDLLQQLDLEDKRYSLAKTLSGGQKRKLCISLALIGRSKFILLDEPTSGMDVTAKRGLWNFLKNYKTSKIILLTTHSLEEADFLADRLGIMSEGKLICTGTSSYLKNQYSCGYCINFLFNDVSESTNKSSKSKLIKELRKIEPNLTVKVVSKESIIINFPIIGINNDIIFSRIEELQPTLGILNFTLSTTSLEDVFLKINSSEVSKNLFENQLTDGENDITALLLNNRDDSVIKNVSQNKIKMHQTNFSNDFKLNMTRQVISNWRNRKNFLMEMISSILIFFVSYLCSYVYFNPKVITPNIILTKTVTRFSISKTVQSVSIKDFKDVYSGLKFEPIERNNFDNIYEFDEFIFNDNENHNSKGAVYIKDYIPSVKFEAYVLYPASAIDYGYAINNIIISTILKRDFSIKTNLMTSIQYIPNNANLGIYDNFYLFIFIYLIISSFINLSGYMINTPLKEILNNVKHLQYLYGMNMFTYWLSIFLTDFAKYLLFMIIIYPFLLIFKLKFFIYALPILLMFLISITIFCYCFSFMFEQQENGQKYYLVISYLIFTIFPTILLLNLDTFQINEFQITWGDIFPQSAILIHLLKLYLTNLSFSPKFVNVLTNSIFIFISQIVIYSIILYCLDKQIIQKSFNSLTKKCSNYVPNLIDNSYTINEREKVQNPNNNGKLSTKLTNINKVYRSYFGKVLVNAVNKLYLGLDKNEKFGLLGYNGSGKSTTFKAMTNEILIESGEIQMLNMNIKTEFEELRQIMGYCPQNNAIFDFLTVEEHFEFYSYLKDNKQNHKDILINYGLANYKKTFAKNLSGGNKRKLNFAIALMNKPSIILLDEPSTGVDPESRRIMWKHINEIPKQQQNFNMVLSTHSLEEAEILCDTVGWMKKGNFICIGNPEKLKLQFSEGYIVQIKFKRYISQPQNNHLYLIDNKYLLENYPFALKMNNINLGEYLNQSRQIKEVIFENLYYFDMLNSFIKKICYFTNFINFMNQHENQFELLLNISKEQGKLFSTLMNMKIEDSSILEINIQIQSLEKIFNRINDTTN